jgi:hypothetical protein
VDPKIRAWGFGCRLSTHFRIYKPPIQRATRADYSADDSAEGGGREMQIWFGCFQAGEILIDAQAHSRNWPANLVSPAFAGNADLRPLPVREIGGFEVQLPYFSGALEKRFSAAPRR